MRRFLIWVPIVFILFLLQSYFWVPTYEEKSRGNPARLAEYIEASIGDAQILNPILSSDSASSDIESRVFEGLIDRDENLNFRGRVAARWDIFEEAYFYLNDQASVPPGALSSAPTMVAFLQKAIKSRRAGEDPVSKSLANIEKVEVLPSRSFEIVREEKEPGGKTVPVTIQVAAPPRIRLTLKKVDQDLFENLSGLLGREYFASFEGSRVHPVEPETFSRNTATYAREVLPAVEHNPVIIFHLRPGVRFHDGHPVTAEDVQFTYEAIMNPRNLSPRLSDYEPVKAVEVVDPLTVRIVYK